MEYSAVALESACNIYFCVIHRVEQNARELPERKISTPSLESGPAVFGKIQSLSASNDDPRGIGRRTGYRHYRHRRRDTVDPLPGHSRISAHDDSRSSGSDPNRVGLSRMHEDCGNLIVETRTEFNPLPSLCDIERSVESILCARKKTRPVPFGSG